VDAISVTANCHLGVALTALRDRHWACREVLQKAVSRTNRFQKVASLGCIQPRLFLVPKTEGNRHIDGLATELFDLIDEENVNVLQFSHYGTLTTAFPITEISCVLQVLRDRLHTTSMRRLIWDIDHRYVHPLRELITLWLHEPAVLQN
jgi:hypothetical protein